MTQHLNGSCLQHWGWTGGGRTMFGCTAKQRASECTMARMRGCRESRFRHTGFWDNWVRCLRNRLMAMDRDSMGLLRCFGWPVGWRSFCPKHRETFMAGSIRLGQFQSSGVGSIFRSVSSGLGASASDSWEKHGLAIEIDCCLSMPCIPHWMWTALSPSGERASSGLGERGPETWPEDTGVKLGVE